MKQSPEMLSAICDLISENNSLSASARDGQINKATVFRWLAGSRERPDEFMHAWPDAEADAPQPFHKNCARAQAMGVARLRMKALEIAEHGQRTEVFFQGVRQFEINPLWLKEGGESDPALCKILGIEKYLTNEAGDLIPATMNSAVNSQVLIASLRALDKKFRDTSDLNVTHKGGVQVIGSMAAPPPLRPPMKIIEHAPARIIEHRPATAIAMPEPILAEIIQEEDEPDAGDLATEALTQPAADPLAEATRKDNAMVAENERRANALRADLEARAALLAKQGPANPIPAKYISMAERRAMGMKAPPPPTPDSALLDPPEGIGPGTAPTGGHAMKVR